MPNTSNKVKFGLKNCYYAIATLLKNKRLYTVRWQPFLYLLEGYFMK